MFDFNSLRDLSRGRPESDHACPSCGPGRKTASNRVRKVVRVWDNGEDFISYNCSRCGEKGFAHPDNRSASRTAPRPAARPLPTGPTEEQARKLNDARAIWRETIPAAGTPAETYLKRRGCWIDNAAVRFVSASATLSKYWLGWAGNGCGLRHS